MINELNNKNAFLKKDAKVIIQVKNKKAKKLTL